MHRIINEPKEESLRDFRMVKILLKLLLKEWRNFWYPFLALALLIEAQERLKP
jgi:hypothetical protein